MAATVHSSGVRNYRSNPAVGAPSGGLEDHQEAAPAAKRSRRAGSSAAAAAAAGGGDAAAVGFLELDEFPAHNFVLDDSEFFKRQQAECWQPPSNPNATARTGSSSSRSRNSKRSSSRAHDTGAERPKVYLTIESAEQQPAAVAVIAALYGKPDAISSLEQHQLVHTLVIADMIHADAAEQQALQALQAAAKSEQSLTAAALEALAALPEWPACLLQLLPHIVKHAPCCRDSAAALEAVAAADDGGRMQRMLLAVFGDLQGVWSDAQLQELLLGLPLPAMQLLLSSDELRLPSEDTVLYTAKQYMQAQKTAAKAAAAKAALAQLVRAPQLSLFALHCAALPADSDQQLLGCYAQKLRELLPLKIIALAGGAGCNFREHRGCSQQLAAWAATDQAAGKWSAAAVAAASGAAAQACRFSFAQQEAVCINSPSSAPLGGVGWKMKVWCEQQDGGTVVGLFAGPVKLEVPAGIPYKFECDVEWQGRKRTLRSACMFTGRVWGNSNYVELQPMAGDGWDAAAWAAEGLPASGEMLLELRMHSVMCL
uniref:BACK domain-containing protein n=1 Tax=Tetradesmus obliquus TaxID=3088 RepID=A0A383VM69_TETOB|eukprot:jgi/Sobl393_1/17184/SZX66637.1